MAPNPASKTRVLCALSLTVTAALFAASVLVPIASAAEEYHPKPYVQCFGWNVPSDPYSGWIYVGNGLWKCHQPEGPCCNMWIMYCYGASFTCWLVWTGGGDLDLQDARVALVQDALTRAYQDAGAPHPQELLPRSPG